MSHFTVLVIGDDVEGQLARFHEFECTGQDDQYVQDVDRTADLRAAYAEAHRTYAQEPDGTLAEPWGDRYFRDPTPEEVAEIGPLAGTGGGNGLSWTSKDWGDGLGYRTKVHAYPEGVVEREIPVREQMTFLEYCQYETDYAVVQQGEPLRLSADGATDDRRSHKYGYILATGDEVVRVVRRTNPNAHWDWYTIGGRWTGFFKLTHAADVAQRGQVGRPGLQTDPALPGYVDQARKGDIDWASMRNEAAMAAGERWDRAHAFLAGRPVLTWDAARAAAGEGNIAAAREAYHDQPVMRELRESEDETLQAFRWSGLDEVAETTREAYVQQAANAATATFAVVKDGTWYQRGEMGWWGAVRDAMPDHEWQAQVAALIDGLPDDTLLTLVDCHI